ncbi:MAG: nucleotidyl transferase AbiEii/AbiGii toxin family protein [Gemmatimonadota bacterium]
MALTTFQRDILRLLARERIAAGERYVAGGVALGELLASPRISRDIDFFHDAAEAVATSWEADRERLEAAGFEVEPLRERPAYVEARVTRDGRSTRLEWARDSAFRFFPLIEHETLGLTLHPVDLATNKVLALIGRLEPRDWIDVLWADDRLQPLGYLAWAAAGKDPGFGPGGILAEASRTGRYSAEEIEALDFAGDRPDPGELSRRWHAAMRRARAIVELLPPEHVGTCVLSRDAELFRGDLDTLREVLADDELVFHSSTLGGAWPRVGDQP